MITEPSETYVIGGAGLPTATTDRPFHRDYDPRWFQSDALEWVYGNDTAPVALLAAPTGAGKTDVIAALAEQSTHLLCVYPTNALIRAQQTELEERGLKTDIVTGDTLSGTGAERSEKLLSEVQKGQTGGRDVFITNPDVLQAAIQNLYISPGSRILNIYTQFDAVVFDEFHYYDPLGASGILTQIKILSERGAALTTEGVEPPKFLLSSATPDARFVEYVREDLDLDIRDIRSRLQGLDITPSGHRSETDLIYRDDTDPSDVAGEVTDRLRQTDDRRSVFKTGIEETQPAGTSRFRSPMLIRRHTESIGDSFDAVADSLAETIRREYDSGKPIAAVIFNSAARSNEFQNYVERNRPELADEVAKDNGYDTNATHTVPDEVAALNTTSKGEVGLDFDIRRLVMAKPFTATQFIQRIGRAGRQSPAIVDIYHLDDPGWPAIQSYPGFLCRVTDTLDDSELRYRRLRNLAGMRSARALRDRLDENMFHNEGIYKDFSGFPTEGKWKGFFADLAEAKETLEDDSPLSTLGRSTNRVIRGADDAQRGLRSLRGRTITHPVAYPRGNEQEQTEYDLVSALGHYATDRIDKGVVHLTDERAPGRLRGYYAGDPNGGDGIDIAQSQFVAEQTLRDGYLHLVDDADDLSDLALSRDDLQAFFKFLPLYAATAPKHVRAGQFRIDNDTERNEVTNIARRE